MILTESNIASTEFNPKKTSKFFLNFPSECGIPDWAVNKVSPITHNNKSGTGELVIELIDTEDNIVTLGLQKLSKLPMITLSLIQSNPEAKHLCKFLIQSENFTIDYGEHNYENNEIGLDGYRKLFIRLLRYRYDIIIPK